MLLDFLRKGEIMNYMNVAFEFAKNALQINEVPVGCVIVENGEIIGCGYNKKENSKIAICHAEIMAIVDACKNKNSWRLDNCEMYVTLFPCLMCIGAIMESRIKKVHYLLESTFYTNNCLRYDKLDVISKYDDSDLKDKYNNMLSNFFKNKRK